MELLAVAAVAGLGAYAYGKRRERRRMENGYFTYHDNGHTGPEYGHFHYGTSASPHQHHHHHQTTGYYTRTIKRRNNQYQMELLAVAAVAGLGAYALGKRRERRRIENGYITFHGNEQYGNLHYGTTAVHQTREHHHRRNRSHHRNNNRRYYTPTTNMAMMRT